MYMTIKQGIPSCAVCSDIRNPLLHRMRRGQGIFFFDDTPYFFDNAPTGAPKFGVPSAFHPNVCALA
jgi:hypothetical protein